jgi:hypothetical protein
MPIHPGPFSIFLRQGKKTSPASPAGALLPIDPFPTTTTLLELIDCDHRVMFFGKPARPTALTE